MTDSSRGVNSTRQPAILHVSFYLAIACCVAIATYIVVKAEPQAIGWSGWSFPTWNAPWWFHAVWVLGLALLGMAPRFPILVVIVFFTLAYGIWPRSHPAAQTIRAIGLLELVTVLGILRWLLFARDGLPSDRLARNILVSAGLFAGSSLFSAAAIPWQGRNWNPEVVQQCVRTLECVALLFFTATLRDSHRNFGILLTAMLTAFAAMLALFPTSLPENSVAATVAAILSPLVFQRFVVARHAGARWILGVYLVLLWGVVLWGASRCVLGGAVVGGLACVRVGRFRWRWLAPAIVGCAALFLVNWPGVLGKKLQAVFEQHPGWDGGRSALWQRAWEDFRAHPLFGVGPARDWPASSDVHSTLLSVFRESGIVGGALFVCFWTSMVWMLARLAWDPRSNWQRPVAQGLLAATFVHLTIGVGYSLQHLQLAYILAGMGIAMASTINSTFESGNSIEEPR